MKLFGEPGGPCSPTVTTLISGEDSMMNVSRSISTIWLTGESTTIVVSLGRVTTSRCTTGDDTGADSARVTTWIVSLILHRTAARAQHAAQATTVYLFYLLKYLPYAPPT